MPKVTIELPATVEVSVRGLPVVVDFAAAKNLEEMARRLAMYGLRKFNDAAPMGLKAPVGDEKAMEKFKQDCAGNARAMVEKWLAGDFEAERGEREPADPVAARAWEIARTKANEKFGKLGKGATDAEKAERKEKIKKGAAHPDVIAQARREIEEMSKLSVDIF